MNVNVKAFLFGQCSVRNDFGYRHEYFDHKINGLGKVYGIDKDMIEVLANPNRGFLDRCSDLLLLDPGLGRVALSIGRMFNDRRHHWGSASSRAADEIFARKFSAVLLCTLPLILLKDYFQYGVDPNTLNMFIRMESYIFLAYTFFIFLANCCCR